MMPSRGKQSCPHCQETYTGSVCPCMAERKKFYHLARWQRERLIFLERHPLCAMCQEQGKTTLADQVHHTIKPFRDYRLFFDSRLWQGLCCSCHGKMTRAGY